MNAKLNIYASKQGMGGQPSKLPNRIAHPSAEGMESKHLRGPGALYIIYYIYIYVFHFSNHNHCCLDLI